MFEEILRWTVVLSSLSCEQSWIELRGYPGFKQHTRFWPSRNSWKKNQGSRRTWAIALWQNNGNRVVNYIYIVIKYILNYFMMTNVTLLPARQWQRLRKPLTHFTQSCLQSDINISISQTYSVLLSPQAFIQRQSLCNHCLDYRAGLCRKYSFSWKCFTHWHFLLLLGFAMCCFVFTDETSLLEMFLLLFFLYCCAHSISILSFLNRSHISLAKEIYNLIGIYLVK